MPSVLTNLGRQFIADGLAALPPVPLAISTVKFAHTVFADPANPPLPDPALTDLESAVVYSMPLTAAGKIDPDNVAYSAYLDSTVGLPLLAAYALARVPPRPPKRLYARREELMTRLRTAYQDAKSFRDERALASKLPGED